MEYLMRRLPAVIVGLVVSLVSTCALAQSAAKTSDFKMPPAPGELIDIGGRRLHILCKGVVAGATVIFEAGLSPYSAHSTYGKAQDAIAPFTRACTYDRAGLGWSDPVPAGRTLQEIAEDLQRLLTAAKVEGPYVLAGHSFGGVLARLFVQKHGAEVVGAVLIDATSEPVMFNDSVIAGHARTKKQLEATLLKAVPGTPIPEAPKNLPPETAMSFLPEILRTVYDEYGAIDRVPEQMRAPGSFGTLGDIPLVVLARGRAAQPPNASDIGWRTAQELLPQLSSNSILIVAENSGHVIPYEQPGLVADAVRRILEARKLGSKLAP